MNQSEYEGLTTATLWTPQPGPQTQAFNSDADELFYGGAAGGGKTDLLLGLASIQHWRSIIFRREFPQLRAVIERSREIYNNTNASHAKDSYNESLHMWRLASGRIVEFGAMQYEHDRENFRGRPHDLYGWDEVSQFTEAQYRFVNTWARTTRVDGHGRQQRVRIVACGNPPSTNEGEWVLIHWGPWLNAQHPNPAKPCDLRWFARLDDRDVEVESGKPFQHKGETIFPRSRTFIPALLKDNPILAATGYGAQLQALAEPLRSQLLYGDFSIRSTDNAYQVIPTEWVKAAQARWSRYGRPAGIALTRVGLDVARGGDDKSVEADRYKNFIDELHRWSGSATNTGPKLVAKVVDRLIQIGEARVTAEKIAYPDDKVIIPKVISRVPVSVDVIGVGSSVFDTARAVGLKAEGINWSEGSTAHDRSGLMEMGNRRAEDWWRCRDWLNPLYHKRQDGTELPEEEKPMLPPDPKLLADLTAPLWKPTPRGIIIESKEDIKKRIHRSPDDGDAVVLSLSERVKVSMEDINLQTSEPETTKWQAGQGRERERPSNEPPTGRWR